MNGVALCAGYGGIEIGIERIFDQYRTVCYVEGEAFAASHLVKKMEEGRLDYAPIWSNVRTFDGIPWRGKVDIITGGFPCQPYSNAGKQLSEKDPRDLWPDFKRIIGEVRPNFLFFENVSGIVKWRLDQIVLDLDKLGYDAAWCVMAASDVGALHKRKRWFLLAYLSNSNGEGTKRGRRFNGKAQKIKPTKRESHEEDYWGGRFESWWEVEPSMGRLVDGAADWLDKLRLLGNGVVPQQAYSAFQTLAFLLLEGMEEKRTPKDCLERTS
jgi:DNA (cytosine-5)-methyltransferase 1